MSLTLPPSRCDVVTLHDTVAWRFPDEGRPIVSAPEELREAAAVVCVSRHTAADASDMFGLENTHVVYPGVDDVFRHPSALDPAALRALGIGGPYLLHAGGSSERKNLPALAGAWNRIAARFPSVTLVLSGPPSSRRDELFRDAPRALRLGRLSRHLLPGLLAGAEAVVVPSLYEGFGLPLLEAMAAGTPVIAADTSSLPEVAGGAAMLVEPTAEGIAAGIVALLSGEVDRDALATKGRSRAAEFTWERCAAEHAAVWNAVAN